MTFHMAVHCDLVGYVQIEIASSWGGFPIFGFSFWEKGDVASFTPGFKTSPPQTRVTMAELVCRIFISSSSSLAVTSSSLLLPMEET